VIAQSPCMIWLPFERYRGEMTFDIRPIGPIATCLIREATEKAARQDRERQGEDQPGEEEREGHRLSSGSGGRV
jgi:hypothetical protein